MKKVLIRSKIIKTQQLVKLENISTVAITNMSDLRAKFTFNGVVRFLGAFDTENQVPCALFQISDNGNFFDCEIDFNQENNNIVLDYTELPTNKNC